MKYIKEFDIIRAFAILAVIMYHWLQDGMFYNFSVRIAVSPPDVFFTLSGFFITNLLFYERKKAEEFKSNRLVVFKNFYIRRALRTYPAYFLVIFLTWLLENDPISNYFSELTFTSNFHQYKTQVWANLAHLWTMAVEQQFYFFWPLVILFVPKKSYLPLILLFIATGVVSRFMIPYNDFLLMLPYTCFDALGLGALLSWFVVYKPEQLAKFSKPLGIAALLSIIVILLHAFWPSVFLIYTRPFVALITVCAIGYLLRKQDDTKSRFGFISNNKLLLLIGRMSYGMYLYHISVFAYSYKLLTPINKHLFFKISLTDNEIIFDLVNFFLLLGFSWLSWRFIELPASTLRKYFKNDTRKLSVKIGASELSTQTTKG